MPHHTLLFSKSQDSPVRHRSYICVLRLYSCEWSGLTLTLVPLFRYSYTKRYNSSGFYSTICEHSSILSTLPTTFSQLSLYSETPFTVVVSRSYPDYYSVSSQHNMIILDYTLGARRVHCPLTPLPCTSAISLVPSV